MTGDRVRYQFIVISSPSSSRTIGRLLPKETICPRLNFEPTVLPAAAAASQDRENIMLPIHAQRGDMYCAAVTANSLDELRPSACWAGLQ